MDNGFLGYGLMLLWGSILVAALVSVGLFYGLRALLRKLTGRR